MTQQNVGVIQLTSAKGDPIRGYMSVLGIESCLCVQCVGTLGVGCSQSNAGGGESDDVYTTTAGANIGEIKGGIRSAAREGLRQGDDKALSISEHVV